MRRLRDLHEDPRVVAWWTDGLQRWAAWLTPVRRRWILSACAVVALIIEVPRRKVLGERMPLVGLLAVVPLLLALIVACWRAAVGFNRLPAVVRRRPQIALHAVFWSLLVVLWVLPSTASARPALVLLVAVLPFLLWRLGYLLKTGQRGKAKGTGLADHVFYVWPMWGGSETPYGKGFDYLTRHEAQTADALARAQLAGVKLLVLAALWDVALRGMDALVFAAERPASGLAGVGLGVPRLDDLVRGASTAPLVLAWTSIYCELVRSTLALAAKGHTYIGLLRLFGFNVFRNTYRPLLAESVVEFWNRYYYYFKELLVEFFFYPTYARWKLHPWLRTLLAIFAAAFVGNLYYHLLQSEALLIAGDAGAVWRAYQSRAFYSFLLAAGVCVSMLREQRRRGVADASSAPLLRRVVRIFGVWTFFGLIHIWGFGRETPTFAERTRFFASLLGL